MMCSVCDITWHCGLPLNLNVTFCDAIHAYTLGTTATPPTDGADPTLTTALAVSLPVIVAFLGAGKLFIIYCTYQCL